MDDRNPSVLVVIPVYNEEKIIERNITKLKDFMLKSMKNWKILIAENGSTDQTLQKAVKLSETYPEVSYSHTNERGKGGAIRKAWADSDADVLTFIDADLSTDLSYFPELISAIKDGYDMAIGSRNVRGSEVKRCFERKILSRCYNITLKLTFGINVSDTICGFKAIRKDAAMKLLPRIKDNDWFFDTELLILAEKNGFRIKEIPIAWKEGPYTQFKISSIVLNVLKSIPRTWLELRNYEANGGNGQ